MAVKLEYFNFNGLAEFTRYMLHYSHQKFEDIQHPLQDWPIKSVKDTLPFGQLPVYHEGDRSLTQSFAIARYVAQKANLVPKDIWEQAQLDCAALNLYDYWEKVIATFHEHDPVRKKAMTEKFLNETVDFYFSRFEKHLEANKGHFGKKLSWVDFLLAGFLDASYLMFGEKYYKNYTNSLALHKKILSLPGVREYVASRKPYSFVWKD